MTAARRLAAILAADVASAFAGSSDMTPSSRPAIRDWVALHAGGAFANQVAWVRAEIDERALRLNARRQARLSALFEQALSAEISFHDAVYE
jgi:thiaminase/transcriptional activator TenA